MTFLRRWSITLASAVVTAAALVIPAVFLIGPSDDRGAQAAAQPFPPALAKAQAAASAARVGPEGVPLLGGPPLGPARAPAPGGSSGGIPCGSTEQLTYHVHARLTIFINGKPRSVPLGIGIGAPVSTTNTGGGPFASNGSCFAFLHTHASDGVIHIEAPARINFALGQFFAVWRQRLDRNHLGRHSGRVIAYVNGKRFRADPRTILLRRHAQIQLEIGKPRVKPVPIEFPRGL